MKYVISIFEFLFKVCSPVAYFVANGYSQLIIGLVGVSTSFYVMQSDVASISSTLAEFFDTCGEHVATFVEFVSQQSYWTICYDLFALDVFGSTFSFFLTLVTFCIGFIVIQSAISLIFILIPFFIWKVTGKILQTISLGYVKPS